MMYLRLSKAIKAALGEQSKKVPISSNKSMFGHLLGAAGAVEAIFTILTIRDGIIPPTINYDTPDPDCDLDYVPNIARKAQVNMALSNSFGFGGINATLIVVQKTLSKVSRNSVSLANAPIFTY